MTQSLKATALTAAAKKDVSALQRIVVDALEDVKAMDLQVFDTEHLSSLFDRVVIASGTSNRQTRALASSVRDKVREAGHPKPRIEGEDNGEWIVVDCGSVVAHVMQPAIRQYYHLEDIWGDKPVRLKTIAVEKATAKREKIADSKQKNTSAQEESTPVATKKVATKKATPVAKKAAPAKSAPAAKKATPAKKAPAAKKALAVKKLAPAKSAAPVKKATAAKKTATVKKAAPAKRAAAK